jgi:amino acid adenylation domain-containing protein
MQQSAKSLVNLLEHSVLARPDGIAVEEGSSATLALSYRALDDLSNRVRDYLITAGVKRGDRVGIYAQKSVDAYAALLGSMKAGAAYVPVDANAPASRAAYILHNCAVRVVVTEAKLVPAWEAEARALGDLPRVLALDELGGGTGLSAALDRAAKEEPFAATTTVSVEPNDLAYILYTSGSTGKPKGVMLTHENALGFVRWCSDTFKPSSSDRFSSHAPFHFDLSILDLYLPLAHSATVVLINAEQGKEPVGLADLIANRKLTVWYSTPTILSVLAQFGKMDRHDYSALHTVFFAGEVFPVKHLRAVKRLLPHARFYNLYGPTETNVCNYHPIPDTVPEDRTEPYPIGAVCSQLRGRTVDENGVDVPRGAEGELIIAGPNVMQGYWNLPEQTARAFILDPAGTRWYRTGDVVVEPPDGEYVYVGRRDRMVKRRGYRIELGEIEAGLYRHTGIKEAAVVSGKASDGGVRIVAFLSCNGEKPPTIVDLKRFCAGVMPNYMIPDTFRVLEALPKTSTDKMDYQRLLQLL